MWQYWGNKVKTRSYNHLNIQQYPCILYQQWLSWVILHWNFYIEVNKASQTERSDVETYKAKPISTSIEGLAVRSSDLLVFLTGRSNIMIISVYLIF